VDKRVLLKAPFRDPAARERLLKQLLLHRFVREEHRSGRLVVEIAHEFLVESILEQMGDARMLEFREALRTLERFAETDFRANETRLLTYAELVNLHRFRDHVDWPAWAAELMLRSAVLRLHEPEGVDLVQHWAVRWSRFPDMPQPEDLLRKMASSRRRTFTLSHAQLDRIDQMPSASELSRAEVELVLQSLLRKAGDEGREQVIRWTHELIGRGHVP
jgi:hypothetical protein